MAFEITNKARIQADKINKEPQIALEINGIDTVFSAVALKEYIRIGDDNLYIDGSWFIGGLREIEGSANYITFSSGTSTTIKQSIDQDKGEISSISNLSITVIDKNQEVSALLKPDETQSPVFDLLGRRAKVWLGFKESGWKTDYIPIFRGFIESYDAGPGTVTFNLAHPDKIIKSDILPKVETSLSADIDASTTVIPLSSTTNLVENVEVGGEPASGFTAYIQVENELIGISTVSATGVNAFSRGLLGTSAVAHSSGAVAQSFYVIEGNVIDIALRLLMGTPGSGINEYATGVPLTNLRYIDADTQADQHDIYFRGVNLVEDYGVVINDNLSITGSASGNNVGARVADITITDDGSTIIRTANHSSLEISTTGYTEEKETSATVSFVAKDSYEWGIGLGLTPDLVDIEQFDEIKERFLSSFDYRFYIKDTLNVKEFLEKEVFRPAALYGLPRKAKASLKYHFPPLPTEEIKTLDASNVLNASQLKIRRSTSQNFYNAVAYSFDEQALEDKFDSGVVTISAESTARIPVGNSILKIESKGLRSDLNAANLTTTATTRRLKKYKFGAEYIKGLKCKFDVGFNLDIGDLVLVDLASLKMSDIKSGTRSGNSRIFEIENKTLGIRDGSVTIDLVDTNFDLDARYALMSGSSQVKSGISQSEFVIKPLVLRRTNRFGQNEYKKWQGKVGESVVIRNDDFSVSGISTISNVVNNTIFLTSNLGFVPEENYYMELSKYNNQSSKMKAVYGFMTDDATFDDDGVQYQMI